MQAYMQQNWIQVLDADKLLPVMDAASISASKVFQVPAIIVIKQNKCTHICSKLNASIGCRHIFASVGCSINLCIPSNLGSCNNGENKQKN